MVALLLFLQGNDSALEGMCDTGESLPRPYPLKDPFHDFGIRRNPHALLAGVRLPSRLGHTVSHPIAALSMSRTISHYVSSECAADETGTELLPSGDVRMTGKASKDGDDAGGLIELGGSLLFLGFALCVATLGLFLSDEVASGFDQDRDGYSLREEWQHGTSIRQPNRSLTAVWNPDDVDADGIPDDLEQRGPWPGNKYPPQGYWVDVIVEAVVVTAPQAPEPELVEQALAEAERVLKSIGLSLTYHTTWTVDDSGVATEPLHPTNPSALAAAQEWSEWSHNPFVRQVFFVPRIGVEALHEGEHQVQAWGGVTRGSTIFLWL